jgi:hypothetical protein
MKEIIINSPKYGKHSVLVDDNDFENVNQYRWNVRCDKLKDNTNKFYAQCSKLKIRMHQFIFGKAKKGYVIDHINGNSLDNTKSNLREANLSQQCQNKASKNKYKGISWNKNSKKYDCQALGQHIGLFDDEKSAAIEYDKYIIHNLGYEGSRLNFTYTQEEVENIKSEICQVVARLQEKENRELPSNIYLTKNNTYRLQIKENEFKIDKCFKTLDSAIQFKSQCFKEIKNIEEENKKKYYSQPITRNKDGVAFILIKYEDKEYECLVDDDKWHDLTYNISWCYSNGYAQTHLDKTPKKLQRYLYEKYLSEKDISNLKIDHINRNRLDNRMSNLEPVTDGINSYNIGKTKNKWGYRGIVKIRNKFYAEITFEKQKYRTNIFDTIEEAALAYNELAKQYYKERAFINVIKKDIIVFED